MLTLFGDGGVADRAHIDEQLSLGRRVSVDGDDDGDDDDVQVLMEMDMDMILDEGDDDDDDDDDVFIDAVGDDSPSDSFEDEEAFGATTLAGHRATPAPWGTQGSTLDFGTQRADGDLADRNGVVGIVGGDGVRGGSMVDRRRGDTGLASVNIVDDDDDHGDNIGIADADVDYQDDVGNDIDDDDDDDDDDDMASSIKTADVERYSVKSIDHGAHSDDIYSAEFSHDHAIGDDDDGVDTDDVDTDEIDTDEIDTDEIDTDEVDTDEVEIDDMDEDGINEIDTDGLDFESDDADPSGGAGDADVGAHLLGFDDTDDNDDIGDRIVESLSLGGGGCGGGGGGGGRASHGGGGPDQLDLGLGGVGADDDDAIFEDDSSTEEDDTARSRAGANLSAQSIEAYDVGAEHPDSGSRLPRQGGAVRAAG
jgi:hypothetical protein